MKLQLSSIVDIVNSKNKDWDKYWNKVSSFQKKINSSIFLEIVELASAKSSSLRKMIPDLLRTVPRSSIIYKKTEALLLKLLKTEKNPSVIASIGFANIDLKSLKLAKEMLRFANSKSSQVRLSVIRATDSFKSPELLRMLVYMTKDKSPTIRSWAQFTIANAYVADKEMSTQTRSRLKGIFMKLAKDKNSAVRKEAKNILEEFYPN